jgi:transcriptional regulator with XRE-family HTH domain
MARTKKTDNQDTYNFPFPTTFRKLLEESGDTQESIANEIGVNRQSIGQWKDGKSAPDIYILEKISKYFNVSTDYLLGISDFKSQDLDKKAIHEKIGLSESAIENLEYENSYPLGNIATLSQLLEVEELYHLLYEIRWLRTDAINKLIYNKKHSTIQDGQEHTSRLFGEQIILNPVDYYNFKENQIKEALIDIVRKSINTTLENKDLNDLEEEKNIIINNYAHPDKRNARMKAMEEFENSRKCGSIQVENETST